MAFFSHTHPWCRYLRVNHNSVLGIRQYALEHGAQYESVEAPWVESWLGEGPGTREVEGSEAAYSLFAFPAEDNFAGVKVRWWWL